MKQFLLIFIVGLMAESVFAHSNVNASITYSHVSGSVYNIVLNLTRDCIGTSISGTHDLEIYSGNLRKKLKASRTSLREITFNSARMCWPLNTTAGAGWEEHVYEVKVDLDTLGGGLFSPVCKVWFAFSECCRNGALTNMQAGNFYMEAMLDKCKAPGNSGPVYAFTSAKKCQLNQTTYHNLMAYDSTDGDILVYELVTPMTNQNNVSTYVGNLSDRFPFRTYCPDGSVDCKPAPFSSPTRGLYHDSLNGNTIFTPVTLRDYAAVAYQVKEYRYISGVRTLIGTTMAEYVVQVIPYHRPMPKLTKASQKLSYRVQAGSTVEIKFAAELADTIPDDSVRIWVVNPIKNSVVNINSKWRSDGSFTWTPQCSDVRKEPYFFIVNFYNEDDSFTRNFQSYAYNIYVESDLNLGADTLICKNTSKVLSTPLKGKYVWNGNPADSFDNYIANGPGTYFLELDRNGCKLTDTIVLTETDALPQVFIGNDTLLCDYPDAYPLTIYTQYQPHVVYDWNVVPGYPYSTLVYTGQGSVILSAENVCGFSYDTMVVTRLKSPAFTLPPDTVLCAPFSYRLAPDRMEDGWQLIWSNSQTDTSVDAVTPGLWWLQAENACGLDADSIVIGEQIAPDFELGNDTMVCFSQFPLLEATIPGEASYLWSNGARTPSLKPNDSGLYSVRVQNICGEASDSIYLRTVNLPVADLGDDRIGCLPFIIRIATPSAYADFLWNTGHTNDYLDIVQGGTYWVRISNICGVSTDTVKITEKSAPVPDLGRDTVIAAPFSLLLDAGADAVWYRWNTGPSDTLRTLTVSSYGTYIVKAGNECGQNSDTLKIEEPPVGLTDLKASGIRILPNPFSEKLSVFSRQIPEKIMITDLSGRMMYSSVSVSLTTEIQTATWSSGMYILNVVTAAGHHSVLLMKE